MRHFFKHHQTAWTHKTPTLFVQCSARYRHTFRNNAFFEELVSFQFKGGFYSYYLIWAEKQQAPKQKWPMGTLNFFFFN